MSLKTLLPRSLAALLAVFAAGFFLACTQAQSKRPANELGRIPILMYHSIGGEVEFAGGPLYDIHGLNIAPATLRRQLQGMYDAGWYPVNMRDLLSARLSVPKGKTPVVLTFDDARPSQYRTLPSGKIDPNCAVGILEAFHLTHPDWPRRATFYVLPESSYNGVPFDQDGLETSKLRFLVRSGYELANHTTSHRSLADLPPHTLRWEMAFSTRYFRRQVPGLEMQTMALPYGIAPRDPSLWHYLLRGAQGGTRYRHRCILLAKGGPSFAPVDSRFDITRIPRIVSAPGEIEHWFTLPTSLYVSDGSRDTVTVPRALASRVDRRRLDGARLIVSAPLQETPAIKDEKKGFAIVTNKDGKWLPYVKALNVHWFYSWGGDKPAGTPKNIEFVPMAWGYYGNKDDSEVKWLSKMQGQPGVAHFLGFNEPDGKGQANLSVESALDGWQYLNQLRVPIGSPAAEHADGAWMQKFMSGIEQKKYRVDFVTVHWYGGANPSEFLGHLAHVHELYHRPLWITEFCPGDWSAGPDHPNRYTPQQIAEFMKKVLPAMNKLDYVQRYSWYSAGVDEYALGTGALFNKDGSLTELGHIYAASP